MQFFLCPAKTEGFCDKERMDGTNIGVQLPVSAAHCPTDLIR